MGCGFLDLSKASTAPAEPEPEPEPTPEPEPALEPEPEPTTPVTPPSSDYKDPDQIVQPYVPVRPSPATAGTEWVTSVRCNVGPYAGTYTGEWKNGQPNGQGLFVYDDRYGNTGCWYVGSFVNGLRDGFGAYYRENKIYYEGSWDNNTQGGGDGVQYTSVSIVERDFSINTASRYYVTILYTAKDSEKRISYKGYMKNQKYDGQGTVTMANGKTYSGVWENGWLDDVPLEDVDPYTSLHFAWY